MAARDAAPAQDPGTSTAPGSSARLAAWPCGRRTKYVVLAFWILVIAVTGPLSSKLMGAEKNDASAYLPASAESTQELNLQDKFVSKNLNPAVVVYVRPSGLTPADLRKAAADARAFAALPAVHGRVTGPVPSADHKAMETTVGADLGYNANISGFVNGLQSTAARGDPGLGAHIAGPAASAADEVKIFKGIDSTLLYATLAVVIILLLLTYRSPVLWILPIVSAGVALTVAEAAIYLLTKHGLTVNGQSGGILVVLVLGASTDYALLLVARYREELTRHDDRHQAMATALHRVSPAVLASASTVVLGLLCLFASSLASDRGLAPVAAAGIVCTFAALVTVLPALLAIFGRFLFWPFTPHAGQEHDAMTGTWGRMGRRIMRRPRTVWVTATVLLLALGAGTFQFKGGLSNDQAFRSTPESVLADRIVDAHFPAGVSNPADVIATASAAGAVLSAAQTTPGVAGARVADTTGTLVRIAATLRDANGTQPAFDTVERLRARVHAIPGANALVGGESAIILDVGTAAVHDREVVMPLILGVVLAVLMLLLRAVVAPLLLVASVAVSFLAALGASTLIFDHLLGFAGTDQTLPLLGFVFLVALGVDYNIFLMSRVREETLRHRSTRRGMLVGLATTGGVITSAGLVLAATFSALSVLPLVFLTEIGVLVAFGVLLDTLLVRSVLVPALVGDLGGRIWWPSRLAAEAERVDDSEPFIARAS